MSSQVSAREAPAAAHDSIALLKEILAQDRSVMNFEHYAVSDEHRKRMAHLNQSAPCLYDNPEITPRSIWFQHPRWFQNSQMPPFHIHYRQEMQNVLRFLLKAYESSDTTHVVKAVRNAKLHFDSSMRGLHGHVRIEEYACFPLYEQEYPEISIRFLYQDHMELHKAENAVREVLENFLVEEKTDEPLLSEHSQKPPLVRAIETTLDFDAKLMAHLGEEEEIVVPMSLTEKDIWF